MTKARQDAWSEEEDHFLAETILHHISRGETQLEAFRYAAEGLARTPAACGFRWNSEVRQHYLGAIEHAKHARKTGITNRVHEGDSNKGETIDSVIMLLERLKGNDISEETQSSSVQTIAKLVEENAHLQQRIKHYEEAWREMEKLWQWIQDMNDKGNEH